MQTFIIKSVICYTRKRRFRLLDNRRFWLRLDPDMNNNITRHNYSPSHQLIIKPTPIYYTVYNNGFEDKKFYVSHFTNDLIWIRKFNLDSISVLYVSKQMFPYPRDTFFFVSKQLLPKENKAII
jgi:hypothetical protein